MSSKLHQSRRDVVRGLSMLGAIAAGFPAFPAFARDSDDYKALVCVLLQGGLDNFDSIIPVDPQGYSAWASYRTTMLEQYRQTSGTTRERDSLLPLTGSANNHAFAPELAPLADLYTKGRMAVVANVGPLVGPVTRHGLEADKRLQPPRLASHSDQFAMWSTLNLEGANVGWGGEFLDRLENTSSFASISFAGVQAFGQGRDVDQVAFNGARITSVPGLNPTPGRAPSRREELLGEHFRRRGVRYEDVLTRDVARAQTRALEQAVFLRALIHQNPVGNAVKIEDNSLSQQLAAVASMISERDVHRTKRQVFVVSLGGFDTHRNEARILPDKQRQVAEALARFDAVLEKRGDGDKVTTFTVSDFGRTLAANASGTDHGWGGHHFVIGGAVKGGRVVGELPPPTLDHDQAWARRGGLIPTIAIEQYGASLGQWFGVPDSEMGTVFPNLHRFDAGGVDIFP
ncbi:MAG: DUF1501 domain-containing protein [Pseudomonadota bacterium]